MIGRKIPVAPHLVAGSLRVSSRPTADGVVLLVKGSIAESAKVFRSLETSLEIDVIRLSVYASLVFWNRSGSPDFSVEQRVTLPPGDYKVVCGDVEVGRVIAV